jgi:hypothetical protein
MAFAYCLIRCFPYPQPDEEGDDHDPDAHVIGYAPLAGLDVSHEFSDYLPRADQSRRVVLRQFLVLTSGGNAGCQELSGRSWAVGFDRMAFTSYAAMSEMLYDGESGKRKKESTTGATGRE